MVYKVLDVTFRSFIRVSSSDDPDAIQRALCIFDFGRSVCVRRNLNLEKMFIEVITGRVLPENIDRITAELLSLEGRAIPAKMKEMIQACLNYINEHDWRKATQVVVAEIPQSDILSFTNEVQACIAILRGLCPPKESSRAIVCQAPNAEGKPAALLQSVATSATMQLSPLLVKSQWHILAGIVPDCILFDVIGDGNCLYHSLSLVLLDEEQYYMRVRLCLLRAALALAQGGAVRIPEYLVAAFISPASEAYEPWFLDAVGEDPDVSTAPKEIQDCLQAIAGQNKQTVVAQVRAHLFTWFGGGANPSFHIAPLTWIYAIAVIGRNGR
jgi:hypothetical protein